MGKRLETKRKMSEARRKWYIRNPQKAINKSKKMQMTKILNQSPNNLILPISQPLF